MWEETYYWLLESSSWWFNYVMAYLTQNPDLFGISKGRYIAAGILLLLLLWLVWRGISWLGSVTSLYFLAALTPKARMTRIVGHVDGDTVKVEAPNKGDKPVSIRFIGVDTPESRRSLYMKIAPFGQQASDYTKRRLPRGQKVILRYDKTRNDKFGRELAYIYLPNGEFYNATLLKKGYAWAAQYAPNLKHKAHFDRLQRVAQKKKKPIWCVYDDSKTLSQAYKNSADYRAFQKK